MILNDIKLFNFIARVYFGVSDNPYEDMNPYHDLKKFLDSRVGDLRWGDTKEAVNRSKNRFISNMILVLDSFDISFDTDNLLNILSDNSVKNYIVVQTILKAVKQSKISVDENIEI